MKTVLVVRKFDNFSRILAENNLKIINLPLIETRNLKDLSDFETKLAQIEKYDTIFLTSSVAAQTFADTLRKKNILFNGKIYVLGKRSFDVLKTADLDVVYDDSANTASQMLENIAPEKLKGKTFLFVRGAKSLRVVPEFLAKTGGEIDETIVYETRDLKIESAEKERLRRKFENREIAAACFFSPSQAEAFLEQFGAEITHQTRIAVIGKTTAEYFERQNVKVDFVSSKSNAEIFAVELVKFLREEIKPQIYTDKH